MKKEYIKYYCIDCNARVADNRIKRCRKCYYRFNRGENHGNWQGGKSKCKFCEKATWYSQNKHELCQKCYFLSHLGSNHPNWQGGKPKCVDCGKELSVYGKLKTNRCKKCSVVGILNPNYLGGLSRLPYPMEFNKRLKEQIRERDNYICQNCNMTEEEHLIVYGQVLNIHHIDYNKMNCDKNNLITVCSKCNSVANGNRDYWFAYYTYIIENHMKGVNL